MPRVSIVTTKYFRNATALLFLLAVITNVSCSSKELAPDFTLPDSSGEQINLTSELESHRGVVVVFYRGFF